MPPVQLPVTFDTANRKKDRSVSMRFTTNFEVSNEDFANLDKVVNNQGWLLFKVNELFDDKEIPKEQAPVDTIQKSPSIRLRNTLWHVWDQKADKSEKFDDYYVRVMNKLIDRYKEELA